MQAKDLKPGDTFTVWEHERHTVCLKTEDGHTYRLKDGSLIPLAHNRSVTMFHHEEAGYTVAEYRGRQVLAKKLDSAEGSTPRYVIKSFVALESSFVFGEEVRGIEETCSAIRAEVNSGPSIPPQVIIMLQELENTFSRGTSFLQVIKMLLQLGPAAGGQVDHNRIMVNLRQFPTE